MPEESIVIKNIRGLIRPNGPLKLIDLCIDGEDQSIQLPLDADTPEEIIAFCKSHAASFRENKAADVAVKEAVGALIGQDVQDL
jgi:hypothetical protein